MAQRDRAVRVAVVNDYELVVLGVASLLEPYAERVEVVELDSKMAVRGPVDVVLYDSFAQARVSEDQLRELIGEQSTCKVVIYTWNVSRQLVEDALRAGAAGFVAKGADAEELVASIEAVHAGERVVPGGGDGHGGEPSREPGRWPGQREGLTMREGEIIALITQGFSNKEIAARSYLSINSVKTYIRTAYRKMGVERRSQAVVWGIEHGFEPDSVRMTPTAPR
ncbi:LuxR C-terminal-related transcriptional regulator [Nocardioides flavescens]|uniref:DNA-binding response regulator n=1 Tax=Nocardioides flavescens TaxID=2691959 RepID=A0A6L7EWE3_9ACTN|nr:response regulator transcription factor [Nocardioides flavescens]MXG88319.1 DNA-binding response regulator [Nocardioides flavescens]